MSFKNALALSLLLLVGCVEKAEEGTTPGGSAAGGSAQIVADGSSTVGPITSLIGEEFENANSDVKVLVTVTGTGTGFGKFAAGETDINDASRPIKDTEKAKCEENDVEYVELMVAMDGISVVVNKDNDFVDALTTAQLKKIWEPGSTVKTWKDVNPEWPAEEIQLFGPGRESGTFDYFTKKINGEEGATRDDYSPSGDDNLLVTGVAGNKFAMGYFGYGYYEKSKDKLKLLKISPTEDLADAVAPDPTAIQTGTYKPLARPVFIYVNKDSLKRPEVAKFIEFYLGEGQNCVPVVGCVKMSDDDLANSKATLADAMK
ncbi:MAG: PstS family phosphate ABC transporter substrate-binding protein [Planctomycetaceae bacterium]|nr:PstS family phosphate ABC transporter substrate-binding protein [Planctomycetaceae bacterium]